MAEGVFVHLLKEKGLEEDYVVDSAGTANYHIGRQPDHRMIETANGHNVVLPSVGRQFQSADFMNFDFILAMDDSNMQNIMRVDKPNQGRAKLFMMRDFDPLDKGSDVPDPYYGRMNGFEEVYEILVRCNENLLNFLENIHE